VVPLTLLRHRYNRFVSGRVTGAICALAKAVKEVTHNASLALAFYGYTFALSDTRLTGSGHLDLATVVQCDHLDTVASPYQYIDAARDPSGRLTVHGPVDTAALAGKLWAVEDDSRTALANVGAWDRHVNDTAGTVRLLRRNL
jgi:hypothetical protein